MKTSTPRRILNLVLFLSMGLLLPELRAQVPPTLSYQGRITATGTNFTGTGQFKFALVDPGTNTARRATATATVNSGVVVLIPVTDGGAGYTVAPAVTITDPTGVDATAVAVVAGGAVIAVNPINNGTGYSASPTVTIAPPPAAMLHVTYWSHDGTSVAGSPPASAVNLPVSGGLFTAILGDTNVANMQPVPLAAFGSPQTRLRIWFNDGVSGFAQLVPDQPVTSVGYAMVAAGLAGSQTQTFTGPVTFNPASGAPFSVNNSVKVGGLNVDLLDGLDSTAFWQLGGNAGTTPGTHFLGTTDNQPLAFKVNGLRALRLEVFGGGPPNIIGGSTGNSIAPGMVGGLIGGGSGNLIGANHGSIVGGAGGYLAVGADYSAIGGGLQNVISDNSAAATIGGGEGNAIQTNALYGTIGGGWNNTIQPNALYATIGGGYNNTIETNSNRATIGGGYDNTIQADAGSGAIGGGYYNTIQPNADYATIGGGDRNTIQTNALYATISGGHNNTIQPDANSATIGGGYDNRIQTNASFATIGGGYINTIQPNALYATISGGANNTIQTNAILATIGGGEFNTIETNATYATISGGFFNTIQPNATLATISGGEGNVIQTNADHATISGGYYNTIETNATFATIGGGYGNKLKPNADHATISGGYDNRIHTNAEYATIPGGRSNEATNYAFAAGYDAHALHTGAFVWSDGGGTDTVSTNDNSVTFRARGGYRFFTGAGTTAGAQLLAGTTAWIALSDRNLKKDIRPVDCQAILEKLSHVPVTQWHYEWEAASAQFNLGPMAQDFKAAFYPGRDDTGISTLEFDGVALAAIQGLNQKLEDRSQRSEIRSQQLEEKLQQKDAKIAKLEGELNQLKQVVNQLSRTMNGGAQ